jgi:hypothetical protein
MAVERYKNVKHATFVHFAPNGKIGIKLNSIKEIIGPWRNSYQPYDENRLILAFHNETFAFLK